MEQLFDDQISEFVLAALNGPAAEKGQQGIDLAPEAHKAKKTEQCAHTEACSEQWS